MDCTGRNHSNTRGYTDIPGTAPIRSTLGRLGICVSPDDASLVLRGFETLGVRMRHASEGASQLVSRIKAADIVDRVLHPALPTNPGHSIWKRDFLGSSGVFGIVFKEGLSRHVAPSLDMLKTFAIGAGGAERAV
ncbi:PLP-dependent transferase [Sinorhizobium meliloti]|uniref:PLP-dependent transferase n=1 Tax=Rhizobium meliloti TaxID=382 RepID=UPI00237FEA76|nr:PLP-dependent transferase [Sinorhizobium meliloti]